MLYPRYNRFSAVSDSVITDLYYIILSERMLVFGHPFGDYNFSHQICSDVLSISTQNWRHCPVLRRLLSQTYLPNLNKSSVCLTACNEKSSFGLDSQPLLSFALSAASPKFGTHIVNLRHYNLPYLIFNLVPIHARLCRCLPHEWAFWRGQHRSIRPWCNPDAAHTSMRDR